MVKEGIPNGLTLGPQYAPDTTVEHGIFSDLFAKSETAEARMLTPAEKKEWSNLFRLMERLDPIIVFLDGLAASETPPDYISEPWNPPPGSILKNGQPVVLPDWPNYEAMRRDYTEAGEALITEYERLTGAGTMVAGMGTVMFMFTAVIVATAVVLTTYYITTPDAVRMKNAGITEENVVAIQESTERVAKAENITVPKLIKKALSVATLGLIVGGLYLVYKVIK
jgi:hypothetical protein